MKTALRSLVLLLLTFVLVFALISCGDEGGSCTVTIVANGKEIVSNYKFEFKNDATVLDAVKSAAKDKLNETVVELKNDRGDVLSFTSLNGLTTALSEDGKTLSYWGYSVKGVDGNLVAISGQQKLQDALEITLTYHTVTLPQSKEEIPVTLSIQIKEHTSTTNYKNLQVSQKALTVQSAVSAVAQDTSIDAAHQTLLASIIAEMKEGKTSCEIDATIWTWQLSVTDKNGNAKDLTFASEDVLKADDVISLVFTEAPGHTLYSLA